ncbi:Fe-S protein assembly co-chaperone HscB [Thiosocius teredinicola]|uniref:Fe-S protein assembly co-chaperone HscB n=1 Tax=Thiosocius teredinicola TaxID=1973002 RepID=UPI0009910707
MFDFSKNYFELFGTPVGFVVDTAELANRYRELQKVVHPDRFAAAGEQSQRLSLQSATMVNEAYETLKDPLKRAQYLLALNGYDNDKQQTLDDPAFLMQQMELRETLEDIPSSSDPYAAIDKLMREIVQLIKTQVAQLAVQFEEASSESLDAAAKTVQKMQFLNKLHAEAEAVEADLEETY